MNFAADGDGLFLHGLQQSGLRFWSGPVDFISEHDLCKNRARLKFENAAAIGRFHHDIRAENVGGHEVGSELDAVEIELDGFGKGAYEECFAKARDTFQQDVATDEKACDDAFDNTFVTDNHFLQLVAHFGIIASEGFDLFFEFGVSSGAHGDALRICNLR